MITLDELSKVLNLWLAFDGESLLGGTVKDSLEKIIKKHTRDKSLVNANLPSNHELYPIKLWEVVCKYIEGFCVKNISKDGTIIFPEFRRILQEYNLFLQRFYETFYQSREVCRNLRL